MIWNKNKLIALCLMVFVISLSTETSISNTSTETSDISVPANAYAGAYLINAPGINGAVIINSTGHELASVSINNIPGGIPKWKYPTNVSGVFGVEYLSNGHFLLQVGYNVRPNTRSGIWNLTTGEFVYPVRPGCIVELDADNNLVWSYVSDSDIQWPHDVERLLNGNTLIASSMGAKSGNGSDGRVIEVNPQGEIVWDWNPRDWIRYPNWTRWEEYQGTPSSGREARWTHINDADRLPNGNTLINMRHMNMTVIVDPTGAPVWLYGPDRAWINASRKVDWVWGGSTPYYHHNPQVLPNGNIMFADSSNYRAFEINGTTKEIVWEYDITEHKFPASKLQDADRLPNGNTILVDSRNNWLWEVDMDGNTVWEVNGTAWTGPAGKCYDIDYIPNYNDHSLIIDTPIAGYTYGESSVPIGFWHIISEGARFTDITYQVYSDSLGDWVDSTNQTWVKTTTRTFDDGRYTLYAYTAESTKAVTVSFNIITGAVAPTTETVTNTATVTITVFEIMSPMSVLGMVVVGLATVGVLVFKRRKLRV